MMRVCVIGGGAAGLAAARHLTAVPELFSTTVFEQTKSIGGTWVYNDKVGKDEYGLPVHSSMYKNMRTNLPKEVMAFPDFPFPTEKKSFIHHTEVCRYLEDYAHHFKLHPYINFLKHVKSVQPRKLEKKLLWDVVVQNLSTKDEEKMEFDSVMVCSGHYSVPCIPVIPGIEKFKGKIMHSHDYRFPEPFTDQRVILLGAGPSGLDICLEISSFVKEVYLSHNFPLNIPSEFSANVHQVKGVVSANEKGFQLMDGSSCEVDTMIFCTGYEYSYPFLKPECKVVIENRQVKKLYKHMINTEYPTMCFVGVPFQIVPFPQFDFQVRFFLKVITENITLPTKEEMEADIAADLKWRLGLGMPLRYAHKMSNLQWRYNDDLAEIAGIEKLPLVIQKLFQAIHARRCFFLTEYKNANYKIIDNENYVRV